MNIPEENFKSFITIRLSLAPESIRHDMCRLRKINEWFADKELTAENVENFFYELKQKGLKNNTLNTYRTVFCHIRDYCKARNLPYDFFEGFKSYKKTKPDIVIFTQEEIAKLVDTKLEYGKFRGNDVSYLNFRYSTFTKFLSQTGCRFGEAANLKVKNLDIELGRATLIETKTNENRTVFVTGPLISDLKELIQEKEPNELVFQNAAGGPIHPQDYNSDLKKRATIARITNLQKVHAHNFRHTYATLSLEAGVGIMEVSKLLGHKDIRTTADTYLHLTDKTLQKAAMRHPLVRGGIEPNETLNAVKEALENLHLEGDSRFLYSLSQSSNGLEFSLQTKNK
ncbi:MAG: integration/recombination protein [Candidatus Curtissbacteria bacterium GW2011_GWA1_41_11]|uniref:Integration/recombination protein n=1 Tax=Candidatus Curtissbacteria bacterium GW2011_GWA1_41_11 TaxID=1618409 RepID=A0A0G0WP86_9BACT|nr:MAG: integration/recombination protein [Candidatus Curtissbacteria bacterium GW2011_GWA1_41_11]